MSGRMKSSNARRWGMHYRFRMSLSPKAVAKWRAILSSSRMPGTALIRTQSCGSIAQAQRGFLVGKDDNTKWVNDDGGLRISTM